MKPARAGECGFVLLLALALILLLVLASGGLSFWATSSKRLADRSVGMLVAESAAESALQHGVLLLSEDPRWRASGLDTEPEVRVALVRSPGVAGGEVGRYILTTQVLREPDNIRLVGEGENLSGFGKNVTSRVHQEAYLTKPTLFCLAASKTIRLDGRVRLRAPVLAGEDITLGQFVEAEQNLIAGRDVFLPGPFRREEWKGRVFEKATVEFAGIPEIRMYEGRWTAATDPKQFQQTTIQNRVLYYTGNVTLRNVVFDRASLFVDGNVTIEGSFRAGLPAGLPVIYATGDVRLEDANIYMEGTVVAKRRFYGRGRLSVRGTIVAEEIQIESYPQDGESVLNLHEDMVREPPEGFAGGVVSKNFAYGDVTR